MPRALIKVTVGRRHGGGELASVLTTLVFWTPDIPPCLDSELSEFPLRMRDWLKNVLVTLYERDEDNNLLTEKQKLRVSGLFPGHRPGLGWTVRGPGLSEIHSPRVRARPPRVSLQPSPDRSLPPGCWGTDCCWLPWRFLVHSHTERLGEVLQGRDLLLTLPSSV